MDTKHSQSLGEPLMTGHNHTAVTKGAEILAGEKGETPHRSDRPRRSSQVVSRPNRLGSILNYGNPVLVGDSYHQIQLGALAEQMDWQNSLGPGVNLCLNCPYIKIKAHRVNVHKNRAEAESHDHARRGKEGIGGSDHLIARSDTDGHKGCQERVGPGGHSNGKSRPAERRHCLL